MRILVITQYFWPENFRINDLVLGLKEKNHEITVLTGKPNYPQGKLFQGYTFFNRAKENYHGIDVIRVPLIPRGKGGALRLAINFISFALFASILSPLLCRGRFNIIFVYEPSPITVGLPAIVLKKIKSAPIMFWMQDLWPESLSATGALKSKSILKIVEILVRIIYRYCDRILVQSRAFIPSIENLGADNKRILYYPNSAEGLYQPIKLEPNAPEYALLPDGFRVTFAGNIGAAQDFGTILAAAEQLVNQEDIHWIILGEGRLSEWVKAQIEARKLAKNVHLLGRYPPENMPRFFALSDVLLVTLRKEPIFALTIPSKVQSYLACAKPIIAALDGEGARIIEEAKAGIVCPAENPISLAQAVITMYRMTENERGDMGARGMSYFRHHFERSILLNRLDEWMTELGKEKITCAS
jgi:glycosyltransferase involved in cell wall biosynthesis